LFRDNKNQWARVDNMRDMLMLFEPHGLYNAEDFPSYSVELVANASGKREYRLPVVTRLTRANSSDLIHDLPGCCLTLRKLHMVFPLTPGVLLLLHVERLNACHVIWDAWLQTSMCEQEAQETVHVRCFMPELAPEHQRVRVVLQICGTLMHSARVLYVNQDDRQRGCCLHSDDDFVSFSAHDGRNEMMFSTNCQSFMRILQQALVTHELDADYQSCTCLSRAADELRVWQGGGEANVLADYVIACSLHEVQDVAHMFFKDVLSVNEAYSSILHEMRVFDVEVLDTIMPYTSLDEHTDEALRSNRLSCQRLSANMRAQHLSMLENEHRLCHQRLRRAGDMESDDEADDTPQTPGAPQGQEDDEDDDEANTLVYTPYSP